ncbi:eukaryotic translation initiation factor 2-alpha kinase 3 [Caerostris extrusa]|uniref:non-specific serine/threonine protein kinase n=1 Tax=Caerostris extrusa TaxID=172846 RepID=A0AAV4UZE7_CAEEX|nr:eukaryotic translation initiation factor 2-alpha kinase 3 [Caerostris extrusa]
MNSIFLNKLHPYLFSDASFPDENHSEWTGWTCILDDVELHKISLHLFFFKNWLISVLCAVRFINSYYHNLLFSNLSNILWEINHLLEDGVCSTELPIRESFAIRIGIFFFLKKWNSKLAWPMKFPYLIKLRHFLFHQCRSVDSNQCTLNWQSIFYRSDINIFEKNLNFFQIWIISILCLIRLERSRVFINLLSNLSEILCEVISMSVDNTFIPMSTKEFLCKFGNLFHLPDDAIQLKDYENEQFLIMFHNTQLYKYRMIYMDDDDDDDKSRYLYIQMQLCRRDNLKTWIDLNCEHRNYYVVMKMFCQIVSAMHYVHKKGLMHRDLKPSNIYFSLEGLIKIGDFGLATQFDIYGGEYSSTSGLFSSHSYDIGTRMYMSPEQSSKKKYNYKTDIFSLGIILFELLVPFKTDSERAQTIYLVRSRQFTEDFVHKYEKECLLIKRMLDPYPKRRPTAWEILQHPLCLPYL